jgi:hypothetical protein
VSDKNAPKTGSPTEPVISPPPPAPSVEILPTNPATVIAPPPSQIFRKSDDPGDLEKS